MTAERPFISPAHLWWPMIAQTVMLLGAAWTYTTAMERRLTTIETTLTIRTEIISDLKTIVSKQDDRLRLLEANQQQVLNLQDFVIRGKNIQR